jgi:hypothetical protein
MSTPAPITVTATAHPSHWADIFALILKLAPLGAAITTSFTSPVVSAQINESVALAEQVAPIVIQIAGITPQPQSTVPQ